MENTSGRVEAVSSKISNDGKDGGLTLFKFKSEGVSTAHAHIEVVGEGVDKRFVEEGSELCSSSGNSRSEQHIKVRRWRRRARG